MNKKGFTLIELIIVISIIAILMSIVIPAGTMARQRARVAKAKAQIGALELGISAFQSDFGFYPTTNFTGTDPNFVLSSGTVETNNKDIIELLSGFSFNGTSRTPVSSTLVSSSVWNGPYIEVDADDTNGSGQLIDPWGNAYVIELDLDGNASTTPPSNNVYTYDIRSNGPDGAAGGSDDVTNY